MDSFSDVICPRCGTRGAHVERHDELSAAKEAREAGIQRISPAHREEHFQLGLKVRDRKACPADHVGLLSIANGLLVPFQDLGIEIDLDPSEAAELVEEDGAFRLANVSLIPREAEPETVIHFANGSSIAGGPVDPAAQLRGSDELAPLLTPAQQVKRLREFTGCGLADCRKALKDADGDFDDAAGALARKGLAVVGGITGHRPPPLPTHGELPSALGVAEPETRS